MTSLSTPSPKPLTIRDIQNEKKKKRDQLEDKVKIHNVTKSQPVSLQLYGKSSKLVMYQQAIHIAPGRSVDLPKSRLIPEQIENLKKRGFIKVYRIGDVADTLLKK
jgi:hypothetical protein